jgi:hypothetical protein
VNKCFILISGIIGVLDEDDEARSLGVKLGLEEHHEEIK